MSRNTSGDGLEPILFPARQVPDPNSAPALPSTLISPALPSEALSDCPSGARGGANASGDATTRGDATRRFRYCHRLAARHDRVARLREAHWLPLG